MNMYDGKSPNDFITFEMMGTEHEFPQQNVHVSLEHCLFLPPLQYTKLVWTLDSVIRIKAYSMFYLDTKRDYLSR